MDRRDFMKTCAAFGLTLGLRPQNLFAQCDDNTNLFFINFIADGGWYPPHLMDPKLNDPSIMVTADRDGSTIDTLHDTYPEYSRQDAGDSWADANTEGRHGIAGNIRFNNLQYPYAGESGAHLAWGDFFEAHGSDIVVVNGINVATGNHITGRKNTWGGHKNRNNPSLAALHAANQTDNLAIPYISYGGYAETASEVPLARISTSGQNTILNNLTNSPNSYLSDSVEDLIRAKSAARLGQAQEQERLLKAQRKIASLQNAQMSAAQLNCLKEAYENNTIYDTDSEPYITTTSRDLKRMARFVLSSFESGVAVSANIYRGGFDDHSWFNRDQSKVMAELLDGLDYLLREAKARNLLDRTVILVSSEFGRPPHMNDNGVDGGGQENEEGRDHWSHTSAMVMGGGTPGNAVVGETDATFTSVPHESGETITMAALHYALRNRLGISDALKEKYPLLETGIDFFGDS